jgi:hypothetical protein
MGTEEERAYYSPVEYWSEDDPEEPEPFSLAEVNRELAVLGGAKE